MAGWLDSFELATLKRNRARMVELLAKVELADQADQIADAVLAQPGRYGF